MPNSIPDTGSTLANKTDKAPPSDLTFWWGLNKQTRGNEEAKTNNVTICAMKNKASERD